LASNKGLMQFKPWIKTSLILVSELITLATLALGVYILSGNLYETQARAQVIHSARQMLGKPYYWGSANPRRGFDCSGLVKYSHEQTRLHLPRTSASQYQLSRKVARDKLQPGDLVFFRTRARQVSHVGIYLGDKQFIHAPRRGKAVRVSSLDSTYWKKRYVGAGNYYTVWSQ